MVSKSHLTAYIESVSRAKSIEELLQVFVNILRLYDLTPKEPVLNVRLDDIRTPANQNIVSSGSIYAQDLGSTNDFEIIRPSKQSISTHLSSITTQKLCLPISEPRKEFFSDLSPAQRRKIENVLSGETEIAEALCYFFSTSYQKLIKPAGQRISLTRREHEILNWMALGKTAPEIAQLINLSKDTVGFHIKSIYKKLDANERAYAVRKAFMLGLIDPM